MRLIIAGGRNYKFSALDIARLNEINKFGEVVEEICGCATGADAGGKAWADSCGIPVKTFEPAWNDIAGKPPSEIGVNRWGRKYWKKAGFVRNQQMAEYADACALFPGGRGTDDMHRRAVENDLAIYDFRDPNNREIRI